LAKVTKQNVLTCKRIKGGRAACWIKEKGKIVFRFTSKARLKRLGIPLKTAKRGRVAMTLTGKGRSRSGKARMRPGCRKYRNGRIACPTSKGWRIIG